MAPAPSWKGYLKLSLVTCPGQMAPATSDRDKFRFHTLNRKTGNRVRARSVDAGTGEPVPDDMEVKGYEVAEGRFVLVEDEEIEELGLESERSIDIETFVQADAVAGVWYDKPYFLAPDGKVGEEAFAVIRDAMAARDVVGISRLVLARRERAVLLKPHDNGILLWTLRYGGEVRAASEYFSAIDADKPDPKLVGMIRKLIGDRTRPWSRELVRDTVQRRRAELTGGRPGAPGPPPRRKIGKDEPSRPSSNVVSIMDALKRSLESEKGKQKRGRK